jgi:hypothetical protein
MKILHVGKLDVEIDWAAAPPGKCCMGRYSDGEVGADLPGRRHTHGGFFARPEPP